MKVPFKRPRLEGNGPFTDTPDTAVMVSLLGGDWHENVCFSPDQKKKLLAFYDISGVNEEVEASRQAHEERVRKWQEADTASMSYVELKNHKWAKPGDFDAEGLRAMYTGHAMQAMFRETITDGMRLMALLSRVLGPNEDPVKLVAGMLMSEGFDINTDADWVHENPDDDEEGPDADGG